MVPWLHDAERFMADEKTSFWSHNVTYWSLKLGALQVCLTLGAIYSDYICIIINRVD